MKRADKVLTVLAVVSLVVAFIVPMFFQQGVDYLPQLQAAFPEASEFEQVSASPPIYQAFGTPGGTRTLVGYVGLGFATGYEGTVTSAVLADPQGTITKVVVLAQTEWVTWLNKVKKAGFVEDLSGRKVNDPLTLGDDIDAVSSATFTSRGIANGVRDAAHAIARTQLNLPVPPMPRDLKFDTKAWAVVALWVAVILGVLAKQNKLRWVTLIAGVVVLGFWLTAPISFSTLAGLLIGRVPPLDTGHLVWYLLISGLVLTILLFGRNLYCYWVCPFGGLHELLAAASGGHFGPSRDVGKFLRKVRGVLAWAALMVIFITRSPSTGSYEPFGTIFSFTGPTLSWVLLIFVLIMGILSTRFWCRHFCPVGYTIDLLTSWRRKAVNFVAKRLGKQAPAAATVDAAES